MSVTDVTELLAPDARKWSLKRARLRTGLRRFFIVKMASPQELVGREGCVLLTSEVRGGGGGGWKGEEGQGGGG